MTQNDVKAKLEAMAKKANARRIAYPANKSKADSNVENKNFSDLEKTLYEGI